MQDFVFELPTRIIFGKGRIAQIGQEMKKYGRRILLVYGRGSIKRNGIYEQVMDSLRKSEIDAIELSGVKSNPVMSLAREGIALARRERVEAVLAVGGGSVIDTAKTIAAGVEMQSDIWDCFVTAASVDAALPVLTVLTVAASASEMNPVAVMTDEKTTQKLSIRSIHIQPKVSILDPSVLFTLNKEYTAYSAVDSMIHLLEGYFNNTEPKGLLQDRMVEGLIRTIMEDAELALKSPDDYDARADLMWAATLAYNGLTTAGMGQTSLPVHMIGYSLSAMFDTPHGASLSILLPAWMRYALEKRPSKFARLAREIFGVSEKDDRAAALAGIEPLRSWMAAVGCPVRLEQCGISSADIEGIVDNAVLRARIKGAKEYTREVLNRIVKESA